ncbi:MAG: hypothetical protein JXK07_11795 [Spirochaetes bacterium]|nr:hypothetical protein [Spirochaetota bacterium]MBN2769917.1 hypothetical protein [Spirochaetota bacterium]
MAHIFYSLSGEGRGHAARARTIIDDLKDRHSFTVFAPGDAYGMLDGLYNKHDVKLINIPGLNFYYNSKRKVDYGLTLVNAIKYFMDPAPIKKIIGLIEEERPDLVITDFEPSLLRAAEKCGMPYISINHQHFLSTYDLGQLPLHLQHKAAIMSTAVNFMYSRQCKTVVSSFFFPGLKSRVRNVSQTGVLLNNRIINADTADRGHVLVYLRRFLDRRLLEMISSIGKKAIVYNNESDYKTKNVIFKKTCPDAFCEDLAGCSCLVTTAGNQLVGEALYLGKPVLVIPEPDNFEQQINAAFLNLSGGGISCEADNIDSQFFKDFVSKLDSFVLNHPRDMLCGNQTISNIVEESIAVDPVSTKQKAAS